MKKFILTLITFSASAVGLVAQNKAVEPKLANNADSLGYYIGASQGASFNTQSAENYKGSALTDYRAEFLRGLKESLLSDTASSGYRDGLRAGMMMLDELIRMNAQEMPVNRQLFYDEFARFYQRDDISEAERQALYAELRDLIEPMQRYYQQKQEKAREEAAKLRQETINRNRLAGEKFIADLKARDKDVVTTESGLVYKTIRKGEGPVAGNGKVKLKYTGRLVDGSQFDSSGDRTIEFLPSQVIKGFGEGLKLMQKGGKYILYIPENLAYGESGPPAIGPAQTLIFEVEVVDVTPEK